MATQARESAAPARSRAASNEIVVASPGAVAIRAYELFEERGREPGHDVDDWLRAERELKGPRR
jgi:UDP-N-acetylmuramoylalanine-D-glutamate ligase